MFPRVNASVLAERLATCLGARPEILEAYLFGSVARGEAEPHSDVDVAVYVDPSRLPQTPYGYEAEVITELMAAVGENRIDLVLLNRAGPVLYHRVLRDGLRFLARDLSQTTAREGYAFSRYCDYVPQLRKIEAAYAARMARGDFGR